MQFRFGTLVLILAVVLSLAAAAQAGPYYYLTDLGSIDGANYAYAYGLNNNGDVVGKAKIPGYSGSFAFLYTGGTMYNLGTWVTPTTTGTATWSEAADINDDGQIVGYSRYMDKKSYTEAFRYEGWEVDGSGNLVNGVMNHLGLLTIGGSTSTVHRGLGINDDGNAVGWSTVSLTCGFLSTSPSDPLVETGYLDEDKPGSAANDISDNGQITGWSYVTAVLPSGATTFYQHAFITDSEGTLHDLGTLGGNTGTYGNAINNAGQVAGVSELADGTDRAFVYDYATDEMVEISPLLEGRENYALGINEDGDVVGNSYISTESNTRHAFLYSDGTVYDLNSRVDPTLGWTISYATDINENGQICGYGTSPTSSSASFILTPALEGDANLDKSVDLLDLTILGGNWRGTGKTWWEGDFNDDGEVDLLDLTILGGNWRASVAGMSFSEALASVGLNNVPEPGTTALLASALAGLLCYAWRKRR